ncbi:facilitated trehalose transporter Tret1-like [Ornithodoros turicata]|uniref:facilitated trehalose transporter Tret1-like n=1 Tax=Ornithodoros turicata TaxID=34597 RepID=UPI003139ACDC
MADSSSQGTLLTKERFGCKTRLYLAACSAFMSSISFGLTLSYSSPALPNIRQKIPISDSQNDWFGSLLSIGAALGGLAGGQLMNFVGRRGAMLFAALVYVVGFLLIEATLLIEVMFVGRLLTGIATGISAVVVPVFLSEVSPPDIRGVINTLGTVAVTSGVLLDFVFGKWLDFQWLAVACMVPSVILVFSMPFVAETPRWLLQTGKSEEAIAALRFYQGHDVKKEFDALSINVSNVEKFVIGEFKQPYIYKPFLITLLGMFLQQFSGIIIMLYYAQDIFTTAGSTIDAALSSIIIGVVQVASVLVTVCLTDRLGRKALMLISTLVSCVSLIVMGLFYHLKEIHGHSFVTSYGWLPLAALCLFMFGYSVGLGPLPWLLMGEMLPLRIKGFATGFATAFNFSCSAIIAREYHSMIIELGNDGIYWFYAGFMLVGFVLVLVFQPETKGKTLEEIEALFGRQGVVLSSSDNQCVQLGN